MEWANKYNSFNSYKGLTYYENYKSIMAWMDGGDYLPPPIECNLDPFAACNLDCYFCIVQRYIKHHREEIGGMTKLPSEYMERLVDFLADWGVRGLCISGGGEPSLHEGVWWIITKAVGKGMKVSFVTNGTNLRQELLLCQWVALSVDAGDRESYQIIKGRDKFDEVIKNISQLANKRAGFLSDTSLCYKFLVLPENQHTIHKACKLAKELGVQDFHARPVDFERSDIEGHKQLQLDIDAINDQFARCHEEETGSFHVYTVTHKFDKGFHVKHDFNKCLATPLIIPVLTDGNAYLCVDKKMEAEYKVGSCYPNPENILTWWGSDKHRDMIKNININKCSRCTWCEYNSQVEAIMSDSMCLSFP
jgi:MoaA/NifB/PqqE/SkfB family radical SAM enzyme